MSLRRTFSASIVACGFTAALAILALNSTASADTYYWTTAGSGSAVAGGSGTWDTASQPNSGWANDPAGNVVGNWTTTGTDTAEFYVGSGTVAVNNTQSLGNLNFDAGTSYTLTGGTLNFAATGGSIAANGNAAINSVITGSNLTMTGAATLSLTGANAYTGTTSVQQGTLVLAATGGAAVPGNLVLGNGGSQAAFVTTLQPNQFGPNSVLSYLANSSGIEWLNLMGNNQAFAGVTDANSAQLALLENGAYLDNATANATATFNLTTTNNNINGYVRDNAQTTQPYTLGITVAGSGMLTLTGNLITYTGPTLISGGTLALTNCSAFASAVTNNSVLILNCPTFASPVTNNSVLELNNTTITSALSGSGAIIGSGAVTVSGAETFSGTAANSYTGATGVTNGTLTLSKTGAVAIPGNLVLGNSTSSSPQVVTLQPNQFGPNSVLSYLANSGYEFFSLMGNNQTFAGVTDANSTQLAVLENGAYPGPAPANATATFNLSTTNNNINGLVRDNAQPGQAYTLGLTVMGNGMLTLSGNQITYSGSTLVSGGTLALTNCSAFASPVTNNSVLILNCPTFASPVTNNSVLELNNTTITSALSGSGAIIGSGAVTATGAETFSGTAANSYTGATSVSNATLTLSKTGAVAVPGSLVLGNGVSQTTTVNTLQPSQFGPNSVLSFLANTGGGYESLNLLANNQTFAGVTDANSAQLAILENGAYLNNATANATATFNLSTTNNNINGYVRDNAQPTQPYTLGLTVAGSGMLTLSGNQITYSGSTLVSGGTLALSNCSAFASAVTNNSVLELNNTTISSALSGSGAIIGNGAVTVSGAETFSGTAANSYTGATSVTGATLTLSKTGAVAVAGSLVLGKGNGVSSLLNVNTLQPSQFGPASALSFLASSGQGYESFNLLGNNQTFAGVADANSLQLAILENGAVPQPRPRQCHGDVQSQHDQQQHQRLCPRQRRRRQGRRKRAGNAWHHGGGQRHVDPFRKPNHLQRQHPRLRRHVGPVQLLRLRQRRDEQFRPPTRRAQREQLDDECGRRRLRLGAEDGHGRDSR